MIKKGTYVLVRAKSAGVHVGYLVSRKGKEVILRDSRWIWYWDGAASLSELATRGTSKPGNCKFPAIVKLVELLEAIQIIPVTKEAQKNIEAVPVWTK